VTSSVFQLQDTIVAIASAMGRGAIALVRLSGPDAFAIAGKHVRSLPTEPRLAQLCEVLNGDEKLDEALVTLPEPNSFTEFDTVELSTHGGYGPRFHRSSVVSSGPDGAPGEFTRRAVLNGKLDILQAEAIGDLIDANSSAMRDGTRSAGWSLSRRLLGLRNELLELEALIAYDIDFLKNDGPIQARESNKRLNRF
jgi:tRNA modification GTPase